uniref:Uncharacterized protein n=1 Tax=Cacopsylla melanoneura TaxID=428564 RepID=A0A8D8Z937_9HEMI
MFLSYSPTSSTSLPFPCVFLSSSFFFFFPPTPFLFRILLLKQYLSFLLHMFLSYSPNISSTSLIFSCVSSPSLSLFLFLFLLLFSSYSFTLPHTSSKTISLLLTSHVSFIFPYFFYFSSLSLRLFVFLFLLLFSSYSFSLPHTSPKTISLLPTSHVSFIFS